MSSFVFGGVRTDLHSRIKSEVQEQLSPQPDLRRAVKDRSKDGIPGTSRTVPYLHDFDVQLV